jgi:hypothetical protein
LVEKLLAIGRRLRSECLHTGRITKQENFQALSNAQRIGDHEKRKTV